MLEVSMKKVSSRKITSISGTSMNRAVCFFCPLSEAIAIVDRLAEEVHAAASNHSDDPLAFLRQRDLFGDVVDDERFTAPYLKTLESLHEHGSLATLAELMGQKATTR